MSAADEILEHIRRAQTLASELGIKNILQPGIVKELVLARLLGHELIPDKAKADARDADGSLYEYLCSLGSSNNFQIDRLTAANLDRIRRNRAFFFAFFVDALTLGEVFEIDTATVLEEAQRQLGRSKNKISHLNLSGKWVRERGKCVYP